MAWQTCILCGCLSYHGKYCRPCISKNPSLKRLKRTYPYRYKEKLRSKNLLNREKQREYCVDYISRAFKWLYCFVKSFFTLKC